MRYYLKSLLWPVLILCIFFPSQLAHPDDIDILSYGLFGPERSMNFLVWAPSRTDVKRVSEEAEKYYRRLRKALKYGGTLSEKCKIYVYKDRKQYKKTLKKFDSYFPEWSAGVHYPKTTVRGPMVCVFLTRGLFEHTFPHELTHAIFREFVGGLGMSAQVKIPLWLNEGMAVFMEKGAHYKKAVKQAVNDNSYMRLETLTALIRYPEDSQKIDLLYQQAPSVVEFLIVTYGGDKFLSFSRRLVRKSEDINQSLSFVYYPHIQNIEQLESSWVRYVKKNY